MGGRIADIAVFDRKPQIFYVATASGGVWKTVNDGVTFSPQFTKGSVSSLGAIAVSQKDSNTVWLGTGEPSSRNTVGWGDGVYKSTDGGVTWQHLGLDDTRTVAKIAIDPENENVVYVAALGNLWAPSKARGLYKTTDGGKSWTRVLYVDERSGIADVAVDPSNPNVILAASWQRLRKPWDFVNGGPGSGIWRSTDGGKSWRRISKGLPTGPLGRIGLSYFRKDSRLVVATVEHGSPYTLVEKADPAHPGRGVYVSKDGGESWRWVSPEDPRPFYFSLPRWDPSERNRIFLPGVMLQVSDDQGATFHLNAPASNIHEDFHAMWIDPKDSDHLIVGEDGGVAISYDRGRTWRTVANIPIGQYYSAAFDFRKPYWLYGGLQDNGCWAMPTQNPHLWGLQDAFRYGFNDGMNVEVDPTDWRTVYSEGQGGSLGRLDQSTGLMQDVRPREPYLRFNWNAPFQLSPFNSRTLYMGANRLFRSVDQGDHWTAISPDLTTNDREKQKAGQSSPTPDPSGAAELHCTLTTISESPLKPGTIWCGTDDGQIQLTRDGGAHWTNVTANLQGVPRNLWVSRIRASAFSEGRAYVTIDGHRSNDLKPYLYKTEDFGQTWTSLSSDLPKNEPLYVITEGLQNPDLLFVGSETSLCVSLDRGANWAKYDRPDFPTVPIYDLRIHPREMDLIVATHGRSLWTINIAGLEQALPAVLSQDAAIFKPHSVLSTGWWYGNSVGGSSFAAPPRGDQWWTPINTQPGTEFHFFIRRALKEDATITVEDALGRPVHVFNVGKTSGLRVQTWYLENMDLLPPPGEYRVTLKADGKESTTSVVVEDAIDRRGAGN